VDRLRLQLVELAQAVVRMGFGHQFDGTSHRGTASIVSTYPDRG
jgi:hypothetical protein